MLFGNLVTSSVGVGQQCRSTCVRAAARTTVGLSAILGMPLQVPFGAVAIAALYTFVLLLCVHLHEMLSDIKKRGKKVHRVQHHGQIRYLHEHADNQGNHFTYLLNQRKLRERSVRSSWTSLYRTTVELLRTFHILSYGRVDDTLLTKKKKNHGMCQLDTDVRQMCQRSNLEDIPL